VSAVVSITPNMAQLMSQSADAEAKCMRAGFVVSTCSMNKAQTVDFYRSSF